MNRTRSSTLFLATLAACATTRPMSDEGSVAADSAVPVEPIALLEDAPAASPRLDKSEPFAAFQDQLASAFQQWPRRKAWVQTDKPLYRPGETIWFRAWDLRAKDLSGQGAPGELHVELINPKGASVANKNLLQEEGYATNDFEVPAGVPGGEYKLRVTAYDQLLGERSVMVANYEPPRIKKQLDFLRKAYGPGDQVKASVEVKRPTGEPLADTALTAVVQLDGGELTRFELRTDAQGVALASFALPEEIQLGDGLLTLLVRDGGVTESISRRVPIVLKKLDIDFFPEGGDLVAGLPSRVYFAARNTLGKPADVEGRVLDDRGQEVARFRSYHDGLGRFSLTPEPGRSYYAEITSPADIEGQHALPEAAKNGCVLRSYDDLDGHLPALRVALRCSEPRQVSLQAVLRGNLLDGATVQAGPDEPAVVWLQAEDEATSRAQGVARITAFDQDMAPLAERLVYRQRLQRLDVEVRPDKPRYTPREKVGLTVETRDAPGQPVAADLALSVVDDTVISYADDRKGHLLSRLYLESELHEEVEEPRRYFDPDEEKAPLALDLLLGTRGWRRFEWQQVLRPAPWMVAQQNRRTIKVAERERRRFARREAEVEMEMVPMAMPMGQNEPAVDKGAAAPVPDAPAEPPVEELAQPERQDVADDMLVAGIMDMDEEQAWAGAAVMARQVFNPYAPVRVFPAPVYEGAYDGPRSDFRDTIFWAPRVRTDEQGQAQVAFHLSDAVTSFRVTTEGVGAGLAGRDETVFKSSLPFSMAVKLPIAVSEGDRVSLPLVLSNELERPLDVAVQASFSELFTVSGAERITQLNLQPQARDSLRYQLTVSGKQGQAPVSFQAEAGGLSDAFSRQLTVLPLGFPQLYDVSGELAERVVHEVDLGQAEPGTVSARVQLYPSPVATMVQGMEGLLREPSGCFEQTSSSNYPNVMVLRYLEENDLAEPQITERAYGLLERGYDRLVGYESPQKGYEWFGGDPGHEALTAYGLVEFVDMKGVFEGVDQPMIARTADWLLSRRDGQGGYQRDPKALDSFGRASAEVTDAYITWSLSEAGVVPSERLEKELARQRELARSSKDPYLLALAANTLLNLEGFASEGRRAAQRLAELQQEDGSWAGADHSITRSGGENLLIETTSLAALALIKAQQPAPVQQAIAWLNEHRGGFGQWGSTQATVLSLRTMAAYANTSRRTKEPGMVEVWVNGELLHRLDYQAGHNEAIVWDDLGLLMSSGANAIELRHEGESLPYSLAVEYRSLQPATSPEVVVDLRTELSRSEVPVGENVRLTASLRNKTAKGQPMTLARVGFPGGLEAQTWQLDELKDKGLIDFYETRPREVVVYMRDLGPEEELEIPLDLVATIPGEFTGPASSAYLYYTNEHKMWVQGLGVRVVE